MFSKVLVANRGEIAVRIQQTLHIMGIRTVAVYSDSDTTAPHVLMADEAWALEGHSADETYLDTEKLVHIAAQSGAEAIHPGYGFLAENPLFATACRDAGITFIGPSPESMRYLGDKIRSKEIAQQAGVVTVPSSGICDGVEEIAKTFVAQWGFPLLVKAAGGGGGRGMRVVNVGGELAQAMNSASREAQAAFGDGRVFLERYILRPRHVEVQVLADYSGHTIHLMERECSIQRRNQKIVEETPSPALTPDLRERMVQAAIAVAKAAGYESAGTAEFLLDPQLGEFYFLEMNARLQVEHPITEAILGLDIVEWQVRIAAGDSLTLAQDDVRPRGHAVECRIYAEDPYHDFAPSTGTLLQWNPPSGPGLRLDSGVVRGQEVSIYYDPLLAKLVAWAPDRATALKRMEDALSRFLVLGVITNIPFLRTIMSHPQFVAGNYAIGFLDWNPAVTESMVGVDFQKIADALAAWADQQPRAVSASPDATSAVAQNNPWLSSRGGRFP